MADYFIRRLLLIIPTFIGITFLSFTVTRYVPGGPVEQAILQYQQAQGGGQTGEGGAGGSSGLDSKGEISQDLVDELKKIYGFDKPLWIAYPVWLKNVLLGDLGNSFTTGRPVLLEIRERIGISLQFGISGFIISYLVCIPLGIWKAVKHNSTFDTVTSVMVFVAYSIPGWVAGVMLLMLLGGGSFGKAIVPLGGSESGIIEPGSFLYRFTVPNVRVLKNATPEFLEAYPEYMRLYELDKETVLEKPGELPKDATSEQKEARRKALEAYEAFGQMCPLVVSTAPSHNDLNFIGRCLDILWHMILPVFCYVLGSFAGKTVLMKNSLMENLGQDYVRTAFAKGLSEKVVIFKHAFRNSLIPLATGLGHALSIVLAGSYLIEKVFNINGFGLLGYESLIGRDYPVTLGILVISSILALIGNIISDFLYCLIDPRIEFS
ncbi:MAG: ABC transporter permease subunit [Candidatus Riflebacteria bacterium]|nr:ABC transporter permease subunit [Candidatus Riflebacteria bacterium]